MQNIKKNILTYVNTTVDKKADDYLYFYFSPKQSFLLLMKNKNKKNLYSIFIMFTYLLRESIQFPHLL